MRTRKLVYAVLLSAVLISCNRDPNVVKKKYLENGNRYFNNGKFREASIMYRNALQKDPKYGEAFYRNALTSIKLQQFGPAVRDFRRSIELLPAELSKEKQDAQVRLAEIYLAYFLSGASGGAATLVKEREEIAKTTEDLLKKDPRSYDGNRLKAELALVNVQELAKKGSSDRAKEKLDEAIGAFEVANSVKPDQPLLVFSLCRSLIVAGRYPEAEKHYRALIAKVKDATGAYGDLYALLLRVNRTADAEDVLKLAISNNPKAPNLRTMLAAHYHRLNRREEMVKTLQQLKGLAKDAPEVFERVGDFYFRIGDGEEAIRQYEEGMRANSKSKNSYQKRIIEVLAAQGKIAEAAQVNEAILKENPKDNEAMGLRASLLLDKGDLQNAIPQLQSVVNQGPENVIGRYNLGRAHAMKEEWELARKQYLEAIRLRPDYVPARLGLAQLQSARGEFEAALKTSNDILNYDRNNGGAKSIKAGALMSLNRFNDARVVLDGLIAVAPNNPEVLFQLGTLNLAERKFKEAEAAYVKSYQANPANARGLLGVVETYAIQNQFDKALQMLNDEVKKAPGRLELRLALGNTAVRAGKYDLAIGEFKALLSGLEKNPRASGEVLMRLGETYRRKGDYKAGIESLEKAKIATPQNGNIWVSLGMMHDSVGNKAEARKNYEETLKFDPDNALALNNLAFIVAESGGDLDQALTYAKRARQKLPDASEIADTLGWIYLKKNLTDNALEVFQELVKNQPNRSTFRFHLGMALSQKGDKVKALKELQTALRSNPAKDEEGKIKDLIAKLS
ncbi:MAG: tetratricopeptide repeat protein [Bryobacterales bacterium]|nr:tetratricopeptide repeat protein [Bryobacterales bacterium]